MPKSNTATKPTTTWSPTRRANHAAAIQRWKPWAKSTGPRTESGKARAAQNAHKHGRYCRQLRLVNEALRAQRRYLTTLSLYNRLHHHFPRNELLARLRARLYTFDRIFHVRLYQALHAPDYAKILLFPRL